MFVAFGMHLYYSRRLQLPRLKDKRKVCAKKDYNQKEISKKKLIMKLKVNIMNNLIKKVKPS